MNFHNYSAFYPHGDEEMPMLIGGPTTPRPRGRGRWWRDFLFDTKQTPGTSNTNFLVRWSATVWHVAKVTLFSCTLLATLKDP